MGLSISHEVSKDKKRVNTAVFFDRAEVDDDDVTIGNCRVLLKISYDVQVITAAQIQELVYQLQQLTTEANVTKLLNQEH